MTQETTTQEIFQTYDMGCAAGLVSVGFELKSLDRSNPQKVLFCFKYEVDIEEAADDYFVDKLQINARTYFDNIKMLKNRIYTN